MKYVMMETTAGQKIPIIFPDCLTHALVSMLMSAGIETEMKVRAHVVSAGFVALGLGAEVHGESESLGGMKSVPADAARIMVGESLAFMPDALAERMLDRLREAKSSGERSDAAVAIGEHAFRAGWAARDNKEGPDFESDLERAWSEYDPPEDIKALS